MADDFLDEQQREAVLRFGRELTPEECAEKFAGHDIEARVYHLKNISSDGELSIEQAARRYEYVSALRDVHERLRRAGR